ncbi:MAG: hypothetical protein JXQ96_15525 [Cyclobacteriaceae bacterium]
MKYYLLPLALLIACGTAKNEKHSNKVQDSESKEEKVSNKSYGLTSSDVQWMREATLKQLEGCRIEGPNGVWLHTPDGVANYKAQWTRDTYYFIEYAGDLLGQDYAKAAIDYLLNGQREDGCIPDRVNTKGKPIYSPGGESKPMADHALDNGPFMALMVCSYLDQYEDEGYFSQVEPKLRKGLDHVNRAENGLVFNDPSSPECVYGFTDIVKKTGNLLFSSLIYYDACMHMERYCKKTNTGDAEEYRRRADLIRGNIGILWNKESGMFWAADQNNKQIDIWGSALAIDVGIANSEQTEKITDYLIANYDQIAQRGQFRHLPGSDAHWQELFHDCEVGTYQNGAFWATPLAWIVPVIAKRNRKKAEEIVKTVIGDFQTNGINECVNEEYVKVPNFVASATNVYALTKP